MDHSAFWVSIRLACWTTALLFLGGLPLAHWLWRTHFRGKALVEALIALPLFLPPTVLGFYLLAALGPHGYLGQSVQWIGGSRLVFSFPGIVLGSVLFNLPFAVRPFLQAFYAVDSRLVEAAWCLGESRLGTFFRVVLPLAWPGILTGLVLSFAHTVGEFGVVFMVGGNIPGVTRTLSTAIYDDVQALDYQAAGNASLVLLLIAFTALSLTFALQKRVGRSW